MPPNMPRFVCAAGWPARLPCACVPGWFVCWRGVIERSTGAVSRGVVRVGAGRSNVRKPRLPKEPPRRASAKSTATSVKAAARVRTARTALKR
jgi:hypothetical protein